MCRGGPGADRCLLVVKMKVLVIGAKGMLGSAMMDVWREHQTVGYDRPDIDITRPESIAAVFSKEQPEVVINCAAYTAVDQCETEENVAEFVNATAVGYLAAATKARGVPLVHISTDYVFDGNTLGGYEEDAMTDPVNAYGRTKEHGEKALVANTDRFWLVRTSWLYGPHGKNFVQTMLDVAKEKPAVRVVNDQHGKPTYTHDLANFIKQLVTEQAPFGMYHGVNEPETTWYDFTAAMYRQAGLLTAVTPVSSDQFPRPAKRPTWSSLRNTKRPPMRPWSEALRDYLRILGYPA